MNPKVLNLFKIFIFIFGLIVIFAAYFLYSDNNDIERWRILYFFISIFFAYAALFIPILIPFKDKGSTGGIFTGIGMYYTSLVLFVLVSVILAFFVKAGHFGSLLAPLVIQGAFTFFFLLEIYLCLFSVYHISETYEYETEKKSILADIRKLSQMLVISSSFISGNEELRKNISRISDELRYISPSSDSLAREIEKKIYNLLQQVLNEFSAESVGNASNNIQEISTLIKERKLIY